MADPGLGVSAYLSYLFERSNPGHLEGLTSIQLNRRE